jgi:hypothetical protein
MTYLAMVLSILVDDPLAAAFCIGMAAVGIYLIAGLWLG